MAAEVYTIPGTSITETTSSNNIGNNNYARIISDTASPSSRRIVPIALRNPRAVAAAVSLSLYQSNPLYRSYLDRTRVVLNSTQRIDVNLMTEYAGEEYLASGGSPGVYDNYRNRANEILVRSFIKNLNDSSEQVPLPLGIAQVVVTEGLAVSFVTITASYQGGSVLVSGTGKVKKTGANAPNSSAIISLRNAAGPVTAVTTNVVGGAFSVLVPTAGWSHFHAYYVPVSGFGDCQSVVLPHP